MALVDGARADETAAWNQLVLRFEGSIRSIARSHRLAPADVDDVVQGTWVELLESIHRIREPAALGGWLAMVTRRGALRRAQVHVNEQLTEEPDLGASPDPGPQTSVLERERSRVLADAMSTLPDRHHRLLTMLLTQPTLDYYRISDLLSMPVGSIGPTRARALAKLACDTQLREVFEIECA